jgi:cystathionine beta-lyase
MISRMFELELGQIRLQVEHRMPGSEGGPTLRVRRASDARELLRFDCFMRGAHWHLDPDGPDRLTKLPREVDAIDWTLAELRGDLAGYVSRAGGELGALAPDVAHAALDRVESALRQGPVDFEDVDPAVRLRSRGEKWNLYPEDVLPLWVADMDLPHADPVRRELQRALDQGDLGYPIHPAPTDVPELYAAWALERYGWQVDPRHVELITDVVQGMYVALDRFSEPGDGALIQTPIYGPFRSSVRTLKRRALEVPLVDSGAGYEIDLDAVRSAASDARIFLLCNPHNPTGRAFTRAELEGLAEIACAHDLLVVADEIHGDLVLPGARFVPFAALSPEVEARTVTLTSASKAFNLAGLRTAIAVFGSAELKSRFDSLPRHIRGGVGILGIEATRTAWRFGRPWLEALVAHLDGNRALVARRVADELPGVVHHPPEATYLAWLDCRALELEPSPQKFFLEHARVGLSDGADFGPPGEGFVRLNFATSRAIVAEALERMAKALRSR